MRRQAIRIDGLLTEEIKDNRVDDKVRAALMECWTIHAPHCIPWIEEIRFAAGTLHIRVLTSGDRFNLDRELRSGLSDITLRSIKAPIRRIKVTSS